MRRLLTLPLIILLALFILVLACVYQPARLCLAFLLNQMTMLIEWGEVTV